MLTEPLNKFYVRPTEGGRVKPFDALVTLPESTWARRAGAAKRTLVLSAGRVREVICGSLVDVNEITGIDS